MGTFKKDNIERGTVGILKAAYRPSHHYAVLE